MQTSLQDTTKATLHCTRAISHAGNCAAHANPIAGPVWAPQHCVLICLNAHPLEYTCVAHAASASTLHAAIAAVAIVMRIAAAWTPLR